MGQGTFTEQGNWEGIICKVHVTTPSGFTCPFGEKILYIMENRFSSVHVVWGSRPTLCFCFWMQVNICYWFPPSSSLCAVFSPSFWDLLHLCSRVWVIPLLIQLDDLILSHFLFPSIVMQAWRAGLGSRVTPQLSSGFCLCPWGLTSNKPHTPSTLSSHLQNLEQRSWECGRKEQEGWGWGRGEEEKVALLGPLAGHENETGKDRVTRKLHTTVNTFLFNSSSEWRRDQSRKLFHLVGK